MSQNQGTKPTHKTQRGYMIQNQGTNPTHKTQRGYMIQNQGTNFDGFLELLVH